MYVLAKTHFLFEKGNMSIPHDIMISISGIRGKIPGSFTPQLAGALAYAFAQTLPPGPIVVSRDSRASGGVLKKAVIDALANAGRTVLDADLSTLPTTQFAVVSYKAAGGIDITASHNPIEWNGLKLFGPDGIYIHKKALDALVTDVTQNDQPVVKTTDNKDIITDIHTNAEKRHRESLRPMIIPGKRLRIAVDAVNGAGSYIIPHFLDECGCDVISLATDPTQPFPHTPEPTPKNLVWTKRALKNIAYDLCIVVDPDADRLLFIDEKGRLLSEEMTLPLVLLELCVRGDTGPIIVNMSTSRMIEDIARAHVCVVYRAAVGELNIIDMMKKHRAFFGGEGNGGVIYPRHHYGRDSLIGILNVINCMRRTNKPLSRLADELPHYDMMKEKVTIGDRGALPHIYTSLINAFPQGTVNEIDGLRIDFDNAWVHIRPSNTEPCMRIIAEARSVKKVSHLMKSVHAVVDVYV